MPDTIPGITHNDQGICNFCLSYKRPECLGEDALKQIISSIRNTGDKYDCVVAFSGGRDSSYTLYAAKAIYNLRVLAVNYDNEFRHEQAFINMRRACKKLNIDFITVRSRKDINHKIVKSSLLFSKSFDWVGYKLCRVCFGVKSTVYRLAKDYKVPLVIWGSSDEEVAPIKRTAIQQMGGLKQKRFFNINFYKSMYYYLLHRLEFPVAGYNFFKKMPSVNLNSKERTEISLFNYIPWDRKKIKEIITSELGWEKPQDAVSTWRYDCIIHCIENYNYFKLLGCSIDSFGYCKMINAGQMKREEALKQEEAMASIYSNKEYIRKILENQIGLPKKEVIKILD